MPSTLCQSCNQNPATIHYTEIKDGAKQREMHLCESCAQSQGVTPGPVLAALPPMLASLVKPPKAAGAPAPRCPTCGITFAEFREKGRLGCPNDYEFFREHLDPLLEKIHGASEHKGRLPRGSGPESGKRSDTLLRMRRELQQAVKGEQYESAARLRDEIRVLESAEGAGGAAPAPAAAPKERRSRRSGGSSGSSPASGAGA